jgi:hypothetical protein
MKGFTSSIFLLSPFLCDLRVLCGERLVLIEV